VGFCNTMADRGETTDAATLASAVNALFAAMGLSLHASDDDVDPSSAALVVQRDTARLSKDWAEADRLRDELVAMGWVVEDATSGTAIRRG
jgi:cysteinyl-tRNA synthetase